MSEKNHLGIFPTLMENRNCWVNLDLEARSWCAKHASEFKPESNPMLVPELCQRMVDEVHRQKQVEWSYGGYLEDRSFLWKNSYLEPFGAFIHLGVDCSVPAGTPVCVPDDAQVLVIDDDHDLEGGWGPRVIVETLGSIQKQTVLIFAHLGKMHCKPGQLLSRGQIIAEVGAPPTNGNWWSHLHLQEIEIGYYRSLGSTELENLDGYGKSENLSKLQSYFPDPTQYLL